MSMKVIENARIASTMLGHEDHGIMTAFLMLEGEAWNCGFGGYAMDVYDATLKRRIGHAFGMEFVTRVLETVGVEKWEQLPGTYLRVESEGLGGKIKRIGHITKNQWFDPEELGKEMGR